MKIKPTTVALATALLCASAHNAYADEGPTFKFSGFGTLGLTHVSEKNADFVVNQGQPNGPGHTHEWSGASDSKLGAQLDAKFSSQWSATIQGLTQLTANNDYVPTLTLGFVKFTPVGGVDLRLGRVPYSAFMISDYRSTGYSQPWIRPPIEVYSLSSYHVDGLDATWRTTVGSVGVKTQVLAGNTKLKMPGDAETRSKGLTGLNVTADIDELSLRASYIGIRKVSVTSASLEQGVALVRYGLPAGALGPGSPALPGDPATADEVEIKNRRATYLSLGMTYDPGTWFVTGEFGLLKRIAINPEAREFYLTGGVRIKSFTPYLSVAQYKKTETLTSTNPIAAGIYAGSGNRDQRSVSVGTRWDFAKNADLKVQFDRISHAAGSKGFLINNQPGFVPGGHVNVFGMAVDFVF